MIEIEHLTKKYGTHTAVSDLSFRVDSGQIYGFLGPNGAGKSTTMNIMAGCLSATEGRVRIDGYDIFEQADQAKRHIGYLPEQPPLYMNESPLEYLRFVGEAKGLRGAQLRQQIEDVMAQTKIESVRNRRISALSKGYRQRVGIAQALLGNPEVIILDEPTVGLDPIQIIEIRALIKELGQTHTVIFSSHILSEVQNICDQILILSKGQLVAFDTAQRLEQRLRSSSEIVVTTDAGPEEVQALAGTLPSIAACDLEPRDDGLLTARLKTDCGDMYQVSREIFRAFSAGGKDLLEMAVKKASLEEVFLQLTEADSAPAEDADTPLAPGAPAGDADTTAPDTAALDASGSPADAGEEADEL